MKKTLLLLLCLCLCLCGCSGKENASESEPSPTQSICTEAPVPETTLPEQTVLSPTMPAETVPTMKAPRLPGPDILEGNAVTIQDVSVEYTDTLPRSITSSSAYSVSGNKEDYVLDESRTYAVIQFTVTNQTAEEIKIADIHDNFMVELIYADQYIYSSDSDSACFFHSRSQAAIVSSSFSVGLVNLSPLATSDVTVYIPCSVAVSENQQENLSVVFSSNYSGFEAFEFIIR